MEFNWNILFITPIILILVQVIWFHPKVFGNLPLESKQSSHIQKIGRLLGIYLLGFLVSVALSGMVVHQFGVIGVLQDQPGLGIEGSSVQLFLDDFTSRFGNSHRNFGHGAFHGAFAGLTFALPIVLITSMSTQFSWKQVLVQLGFWTLSLALIAGLISHFM